MTSRTPLRPLARILEARAKGENPDAIERENLRLRHEAQRDRLRQRAESRLVLMALVFLMAFGSVGVRMAALATTEAEEPRVAASTTAIHTTRADIVDRRGRVLATNFATNALYAHPHEIVRARPPPDGLPKIFPEMDGRTLPYPLSPRNDRSCGLPGAPVRPTGNSRSSTWATGALFGPRDDAGYYPKGPNRGAWCWGGAGHSGRSGETRPKVIGGRRRGRVRRGNCRESGGKIRAADAVAGSERAGHGGGGTGRRQGAE